MGAFSDLLAELRGLIGHPHRVSFIYRAWEPAELEASDCTWSASCEGYTCYGRTGEEALRFLVEQIRRGEQKEMVP